MHDMTPEQPAPLPADLPVQDGLFLVALAKCDGNAIVEEMVEKYGPYVDFLDLVLEHIAFHFHGQQHQQAGYALEGQITLPIDCFDACVYLATATLQAMCLAHSVPPVFTRDSVFMLIKVMSDFPGFFFCKNSPAWPFTDRDVRLMKAVMPYEEAYNSIGSAYERLQALDLVGAPITRGGEL